MKMMEERYIHVSRDRFAVNVSEDENIIVLDNSLVLITNEIINTQTCE